MHRSSNVRWDLTRFRQSFRDRAHGVGTAIREEAREGLRRARTVPAWYIRVYHDYGLKHICLMTVLVIYLFFGAAVFYLCEFSNDMQKERTWQANVQKNRTRLVTEIVASMFNNTEFLFFLTADQTRSVELRLDTRLAQYEKQLGIRYSDQKLRWDFWNAMLYAQTICTTIGYGHLFPSTTAGRVFTMLYAICGIPLVLCILDDLGKLLTKCLKTPWWLLKCACRRIFRYCTKQTMEEIRKLDAEDKRDLEIFDLPVPVAVLVVIAWIFVCSATFCLWERDWDYFVAFYFFFTSLSTIGLGDITPTEPKYLLMLFIYIIIGLSLVSMCINLIQAKLERTYQAGRHHLDNSSSCGSEQFLRERIRPRRGSSLGVFKSVGSSYSISREAVQAHLANKPTFNKSSQTLLSFPSPSRNSLVCRSVDQARMKFLPRTTSVDEVMRLVDTEEGDILLLMELTREESGISDVTTDTRSDTISDSQIVVSRSFDTSFNPHTLKEKAITLPTQLAAVLSGALPSTSRESYPPVLPLTVSDLEAIEELEDLVLFGGNSSIDQAVHFRSRLSLIPEQQSVVDDDAERCSPTSSPSDDVSERMQQFEEENESTATTTLRPEQNASRRSRKGSASGVSSVLNSLLGRNKRRTSNTDPSSTC